VVMGITMKQLAIELFAGGSGEGTAVHARECGQNLSSLQCRFLVRRPPPPEMKARILILFAITVGGQASGPELRRRFRQLALYLVQPIAKPRAV
jgi:hypothetical protein